jgi:hypothetical protein
MAYRGSALCTGTSVSAVAGTLTGQFSFDGLDALMRYRASLVSRSFRLLQLRWLASVASTTKTWQRAAVHP